MFQIKCCVFNLSVLFFGLVGCFEVCSLPDLNLKQQFQVVKSVLLHFILETKNISTTYRGELGTEGEKMNKITSLTYNHESSK